MDFLFTLPWWVLAGLALAAGVSRGLAGFGIGLVMMPIGVTLVPPVVLVPVLAVLDTPAAVFLLKGAWRHVDKRDVAVLAGAAAIGIPVGILMLKVIEGGTLAILANIVALAAAIALMAGVRLKGKASKARSVGTGLLAGVLQGSVSLPGPPIILGWVASQVPGPVLRANIIALFVLIDVAVVVMFFASGFFTLEVLLLGGSLLPIYLMGVLIGRALFGYVPEKAFQRIVLGLIILGAVGGLGMALFR